MANMELRDRTQPDIPLDRTTEMSDAAPIPKLERASTIVKSIFDIGGISNVIGVILNAVFLLPGGTLSIWKLSPSCILLFVYLTHPFTISPQKVWSFSLQWKKWLTFSTCVSVALQTVLPLISTFLLGFASANISAVSYTDSTTVTALTVSTTESYATVADRKAEQPSEFNGLTTAVHQAFGFSKL